MSTQAALLIDDVHRAGGVIQLNGANLLLMAPAPLPDDLRAALRAHKAEVVALLAAREEPVAPSVVPVLEPAEAPSPSQAAPEARSQPAPGPAASTFVPEPPPWRQPTRPVLPPPETRAALARLWQPGPWSAGIPDGWARGIGRVVMADAPPRFPVRAWETLVRDIARLMDSGQLVAAIGLGWGETDLFGCDPRAPHARVDRTGLLLRLEGRELARIEPHQALIRTATGAVLVSPRPKHADPGVVPVWALLPRPRVRRRQTGPPVATGTTTTTTTNAGGGTALAGVAATLATET